MQAVEERLLRSDEYDPAIGQLWQDLLHAPDDDGRPPLLPDDDADIVIAPEGDDDLVSQQSGATAATVGSVRDAISSRTDATYSRAFLNIVRGHSEGASLPNFSIVSLEAPEPPSPRERDQLTLLVAGLGQTTQTVWHEVSSGTTLLPGVRVDFAESTACNFCPRKCVAGTPVVNLKHVASFDATEQRIYLSVRISCPGCARKRSPAVRDVPLLSVNRVYLQERLTAHLHYVVTAMRPVFDTLRLVQDDDAVACDTCYAPRRHDDDVLLVLARRRDNSELAVFTVCSDACRAKLKESLRSITDESIVQPRPVRPSDTLNGALTVIGGTRTRSKLHNPEDMPISQWVVLSDDEFRAIASRGAEGLQTVQVPLIHHCTQVGCFCRATHRGLFRTDMMRLGGAADAKGKGRATTGPDVGVAVSPHYMLQLVYDRLRAVHLYTDILGSETQTRCLACQRPTTSFCSECLAVRSCASDECRRKSLAAHAKLCRPYRDAWSPLAIQ